MPYSNHANRLNCGDDISNQCVVPAGKRLIIEHISGEFTSSVNPTSSIIFIVTDPVFGPAEIDAHSFIGYPITGGGLFGFSTPFKMMMSPGASYYVASGGKSLVNVSGYLVNQP